MTRQIIATDKAPAAIGPYSQAVASGGLVFCSGQIALDPASGTIVKGDAAAQTKQCMDNLMAVLKAAGCSAADVLKTQIFLTDMVDFAAVNEVYGTYFTENPPARACVAVKTLPKNVDVEIDAIARQP